MKTKPNVTIKLLRKIIGRSQSEFATMIGATKDAVVSWENGRNKLSPAFAQRIRVATGANIAGLMEGTKAPLNPLGKLYTPADFEQWRKRFGITSKDEADRLFPAYADCLWLILQAAAQKGLGKGEKDRLPAVWMSYLEWLDQTRRDFKLEKEIDQLLAPRSFKNRLTMTYGDWRKDAASKLPAFTREYGFKDDKRKKDSEKLTLEIIVTPGWAAGSDMRKKETVENEFTLGPGW